MHDSVLDDTQSDYRTVRADAAQRMTNGVWQDRFVPRFVPFSSRELTCELPKQAIKTISEGKHYLSYRGLPLAKDPLDLSLYEMLLFEVKPRTIIELGAYSGASALWMADRLKSIEVETHIISLDIDLSLVDPLAQQQSNVEFIEGDCNFIEDVFSEQRLAALPHPLIIIDDAHVNIEGVYEHFDAYALRKGDYLIIEDTIPWIPGTFGPDGGGKEWGDWKWEEIKRFFFEREDRYQVDRYYTDFFGYNATWNWNGFVKRLH